MIAFVVAMDENRVIGKNNQLPWHLPADLKYFKNLTMNGILVMGRKTHEAIGKPLPGRTNIVLTRDKNYVAEGCQVIHTIDEIPVGDGRPVYVIGGAEIFKQLLPKADLLYVTQIHAAFAGDTYFPEIDPAVWRVHSVEKGQVDERNRYEHDFVVYERICSQ